MGKNSDEIIKEVIKNHSYKTTSYLDKLIEQDNTGKISKQFIPDIKEIDYLPYESDDPISDNNNKKAPHMVHRYNDRILILTTDNCFAYCRHCFRRHLTGKKNYSINNIEIKDIVTYIKNNSQIHEVILSGGDPITLEYKTLHYLITEIKSLERNIVIRIGTRAPVVNPKVIDNKLLNLFKQSKPIWFVLHINTIQEITDEFIECINRINSAGIPILSQTVLLKGINNSVVDLKNLFYRLIELNIKPYYLFHGDLAVGTSHFRTSLSESIDLIKKLRREVSGIAMPQLAVDLPNGGKIPLGYNYFVSEDDDSYIFKNLNDQLFKWPKE